MNGGWFEGHIPDDFNRGRLPNRTTVISNFGAGWKISFGHPSSTILLQMSLRCVPWGVIHMQTLTQEGSLSGCLAADFTRLGCLASLLAEGVLLELAYCLQLPARG